MKIIRIIFTSLLALILLVFAAGFIFFQIFDTEQVISQITKKAAQRLGRPVSVGSLGLGLSSRGISIDAGSVVIADDTDFTSQPFIKIDKVRIFPDVRAMILQRKVHVKEIFVMSPQIHFIRNMDGEFNIRSLGLFHEQPAQKDAIVEAVHGSSASDKAGDIGAPLAVTQSDTSKVWGANNDIPAIKIADTSISYIDQDLNTPLDIWMNGLDANLDISSLSGSARLSFSGGTIKDFNIVKTLLSFALGPFGGSINIFDKLIPEDFILQNGSVQLSRHDQAVFIDDLMLQTNIFEFTAKGAVDQGSNLDIQTMLHLNNDISASLVNELDGLKYLVDDSKRIAVGASLEGTISHMKYKPNKDFKKKSKKFWMREGGQILNALFR